MSFLNPLLLLAGLGIALPIVAHLLNRYQVKRTPWAAMQFLDRSVRVRSRQLRLRDLFLLCLRCLFVLLVAFSLARPSLDGGGAAWLPGEPRAGVVIALDASFSMQHRDGSATRFDRAKDLIQSIAGRVQAGDPVSLVCLGSQPRVLVRNMAFEAGRFQDLLESQEVTADKLDWDRVPRLLGELIDDMESHQKEIYLVTDFQSSDWDKEAVRWQDDLAALTQRATVFMVPVSGSGDNLAVTQLELVSGTLSKGGVARYQATVRNCGPVLVTNIEVICRADGVEIDRQPIASIAPGTSETVSLVVPLFNAGSTRITAEVEDDSLETDNVRRLVSVVRDRVSVLCVDGGADDAGRLVLSALLAREDGTNDEDYLVSSVPWLALPSQNLEKYDVVILANVPTLTPDLATELSRYVQQGNGLVWFAGDQVKAAEWNQRSAKTVAGKSSVAIPLLPARLGPPMDCSDSLGAGKPLDPELTDHVLCRPLRSLPADLLSETRFLRCFEVEPTPTSFSILNLAGSRSPVLIEHSIGRGQVIMFTTSAEATWNNMALTPVFPMLMQQIVTYLAGREYEFPRLVGDPLSLAYTERPDASDALFETPSNQTLSVPVTEYQDRFVAMLESANEPGFYVARVSLQSRGTPIAVNVNSAESEVACLDLAQMVGRFEGTDLVLAGTEVELLTEMNNRRTAESSWRFIMMVGLVLLVLESLVADRQQRRAGRLDAKHSPESRSVRDASEVNHNV